MPTHGGPPLVELKGSAELNASVVEHATFRPYFPYRALTERSVFVSRGRQDALSIEETSSSRC